MLLASKFSDIIDALSPHFVSLEALLDPVKKWEAAGSDISILTAYNHEVARYLHLLHTEATPC